MKWIGSDNCRILSVETVRRGMLVKKKIQNTKKRNRDVHCFCFKLSGKSMHTSADDSLLLEPNMVLYIPKNLDYYVNIEEEGPSLSVDFHLNPECVYTPRMKLMSPKNPMQMHRIFSEMYSLSAGINPGDSYTLIGHLYQLMGLIENQLSSTGSSDGYYKIEPALLYIRDNLSDQLLSEAVLAGMCGYSIGYFRRLFTSVIGMSPLQYIITKRMERAVSMLKSRIYSIAEVASETGYSNVYYFSTAFKRFYGEPPGKWVE